MSPTPEARESDHDDADSDTIRVNGATNGHASSPAKTSKKGKERRVIDGWLEGSDPKVDLNPHYEFGGTLGVSAMMIGFPPVSYTHLTLPTIYSV